MIKLKKYAGVSAAPTFDVLMHTGARLLQAEYSHGVWMIWAMADESQTVKPFHFALLKAGDESGALASCKLLGSATISHESYLLFQVTSA